MMTLPEPLRALLIWFSSGWLRLACVLTLTCTVSALAVSYAATQMRAAYARQESVQRARDALLDERGRLLLERSAFSSFSHVETVAGTQLQMHVPNANETRLVLP